MLHLQGPPQLRKVEGRDGEARRSKGVAYGFGRMGRGCTQPCLLVPQGACHSQRECLLLRFELLHRNQAAACLLLLQRK